jgi:hypothetical protein
MKPLDPALHRARPWRVHRICSDFRLRDVWQIPIVADPARDSFRDVVDALMENGVRTESRAANALFATRVWVGARLGWDHWQAVPGSGERDLKARLTEEDRRLDTSASVPLKAHQAEFGLTYVFSEEALVELSNSTIYAALHLGWVDAPGGAKTVELAIYTKSRGWRSEAYMAAIKPFRHAVVYGPWLRALRSTWERRRRARPTTPRAAPTAS